MPLLVGGSGERLTLPIVARHADRWDLPSGATGRTPEDLLRNWDRVMDEKDYRVPATTADCLAFGFEQLRNAGIEVPELGVEEFRRS